MGVAAPVLIEGASRPYPGETENGDAWVVAYDSCVWRIALIDGLGHGPDAAHAAQQARAILSEDPCEPPADILSRCHVALRGTRGAAIASVTIDLQQQSLTFAGVGNVEARLRFRDETHRCLSDRGIVGVAMPRQRPITLALKQDWLLVMFTDGVSGRFDLEALLCESDSYRTLAELLISRFGRSADDATCVVAGSSRR